jgi:hypothetical protein
MRAANMNQQPARHPSIRHAVQAMLLVLSLSLLRQPASALAGSVGWNELDAATRSLLVPWQDGWDRISAEDRQRLLANASRWQAMSGFDRAAFLRRSAAWDALPQPERTQRRVRYSAWRALLPEDQARVRVAALRFTALPATEQQSRRMQFAALDADSQRSWLLGPTSGGWIASVLPLFAYMPDGERAPTLAMLQALPLEAHTPLLQLAQRLPEQQRETLRRDLLATAAPVRLQLLQRRLAQ